MTTLLIRWIRRTLRLPPLPTCQWCGRVGTASVEIHGDHYCTDCVSAARF